jgi:hypothetical protein
MMYLKKTIFWFLRFLLFLIVLAGFVASAVSAVITVIPDSAASKMCMLGYKAHCSFAPISTIILVIMAVVFGLIFVRVYRKKILQIARAR